MDFRAHGNVRVGGKQQIVKAEKSVEEQLRTAKLRLFKYLVHELICDSVLTKV